jgi:hypothetical protein
MLYPIELRRNFFLVSRFESMHGVAIWQQSNCRARARTLLGSALHSGNGRSSVRCQLTRGVNKLQRDMTSK